MTKLWILILFLLVFVNKVCRNCNSYEPSYGLCKEGGKVPHWSTCPKWIVKEDKAIIYKGA